MKQTGLAPIVIVLLLAALAMGGYLIYNQQAKPITPLSTLTPSTNPESTSSADITNWKTYTKDKFWTIKYPPSWNVIKESDDGITGIIFSDSNQIGNPGSGNIQVQVRWAGRNISYDSLLFQKVGKVEYKDGSSFTIVKKLNVDGYPAVVDQNELVNNGPAKPAYLYQISIKGPLNVSISASFLKYNQPGFSKESNNKTYLPILDQMFSTFKFTK